MPQVELVCQHPFGLRTAVDGQTGLGIERVGDDVAAGPGGSAADHEHALDAIARGVVVRAQLPVAHSGLAVVHGKLRHGADEHRRILLRVGLNLENLDVQRQARPGGVGGVAASPVQTVARDSQSRRAPPRGKSVQVAAAPLARGRILLRWRRRHPVDPFEVAKQAQLLRGDERALVSVLGRGGRVELASGVHAAARQLRKGNIERREGGRHAVHGLPAVRIRTSPVVVTGACGEGCRRNCCNRHGREDECHELRSHGISCSVQSHCNELPVIARTLRGK